MRREFRQPDLPVGKVAAPVVVDYWPSSPPRTHASHSRNSDSGFDAIRDSRIASSPESEFLRSEKLQSTESHTGATALKIAFPAISTLLSAYQFRGRLIDCVICVSAGLSPYSLGKSLLPIHAHLCAYAEAFCHVSRSAFLSSVRDASTRAAAIALCADSYAQSNSLSACLHRHT